VKNKRRRYGAFIEPLNSFKGREDQLRTALLDHEWAKVEPEGLVYRLFAAKDAEDGHIPEPQAYFCSRRPAALFGRWSL